jgi:hypothetical protein
MYGREVRCIGGFWWGDLRERDHLKNLGVDEKMMLSSVLTLVGWGRGMD